MINYQKIFQLTALLIISMLFFFSCSSPQWPAAAVNHQPEQSKTNGNGTTPYLLNPGDEIEIKFFYYPELNDLVTIRPDGKLNLQLLPELSVTGLSVKELKQKLIKEYTTHLKQPEITIIMRSFSNQRIFIGGEVNAPQVLPLIDQMDVLQAVIQAGGFNEDARKDSVIVISRDENKNPYGRILNVQALLNGKEQVKNIYLKPYDIVVVPKTQIAQLNMFVKQYIRDMLPVETTFQGGYQFTELR